MPNRRKIRPADGATWVEVAPGVKFQLPTLIADEVAVDDRLYSVAMTIDMTPDGLRPIEVKVTAQTDRDGVQRAHVTGTVLREVPVLDITREAMVNRARIGSGHAIDLQREGVGQFAAMKGGGATDDLIRWVAYVYNWADVLAAGPLQTVAAQFEVSPATAGRWVRRARDKGLIPEVDHGE